MVGIVQGSLLSFEVSPDPHTLTLCPSRLISERTIQLTTEHLRVGATVSDMTIPGIPLNYVNEGFKRLTGYGKEMIGTNCRFLQGPETELYLNDEIVEALRNCEQMHIKLHNYKKNNTKFQLLLCLHPVFGPSNEYKYQIGLQLDFNEDKDLYEYLAECDNFMRIVPNTLDSRPCEAPPIFF